MYIYMYIYVSILNVYVYIYIYVHTYIHTYKYDIYLYTRIYIYVSMYKYIYVHRSFAERALYIHQDLTTLEHALPGLDEVQYTKSATQCNTLQHTATHCNTLYCTTMHWYTLQVTTNTHNSLAQIRKHELAFVEVQKSKFSNSDNKRNHHYLRARTSTLKAHSYYPHMSKSTNQQYDMHM
jgi:hypothetical protein